MNQIDCFPNSTPPDVLQYHFNVIIATGDVKFLDVSKLYERLEAHTHTRDKSKFTLINNIRKQ